MQIVEEDKRGKERNHWNQDGQICVRDTRNGISSQFQDIRYHNSVNVAGFNKLDPANGKKQTPSVNI
jgi:hypothetical protein